ncbi:MAG: type II toxin-antitoxin system PemK/MazF family toxin [Steroidobacteraceae bacterium]
MKRGEIWWASLPEPARSGPGFRRPVLVVSGDSFNQSKIATVIAATITSNLKLADAPGNVRCGASGTGLAKPSIVNVSQLVTLDKSLLTARAGRLGPAQMSAVERGLELVLGLGGRKAQG